MRIGVIFGGRSAEHDVSCASALAVLRALDRTRFEPVAIGMTRQGRFVVPSATSVAAALGADAGSGTAIDDRLEATGDEVHLVASKERGRVQLVSTSSPMSVLAELDVVFPVLHGPYGEDGTLQGCLEVLGVPYVGSGVLGSALGMDKVAAKGVFATEGLAQLPYLARSETAWRLSPDSEAVVEALGLPVFVKPSNLGSSVGISKVEDPADLDAAVEMALLYDDAFVVEAGIDAREIECGVMGGASPEASPPGEIVVVDGFYDFDAKYITDVAEIVVPADLPDDVVATIQRDAVRAFEVVGAWGLARVDFFYDQPTGAVYVNEINTMPGFTSISMFAKVWEAAGVPYEEQIERLDAHAFERYELMQRRGRVPGRAD